MPCTVNVERSMLGRFISCPTSAVNAPWLKRPFMRSVRIALIFSRPPLAWMFLATSSSAVWAPAGATRHVRPSTMGAIMRIPFNSLFFSEIQPAPHSSPAARSARGAPLTTVAPLQSDPNARPAHGGPVRARPPQRATDLGDALVGRQGSLAAGRPAVPERDRAPQVAGRNREEVQGHRRPVDRQAQGGEG